MRLEITQRSVDLSDATKEHMEARLLKLKRFFEGVLDIHGWGGLQEQLNALSKQGEWAKMGTLIDDEILNTFAVVGAPEDIAPELSQRYGDVIQRISFYAPYASDPDRWAAVMAALQAA